MKMLTVKQPWAYAISRFGKTVENRSSRPPKALIGERIAIHVSQNADKWNAFCDGEILDTPAHLQPMRAWERESAPFGDFGHIIATARIVGWIDATGAWGPGTAEMVETHGTAWDSPWFDRQKIGVILADVQELVKPIGPLRGKLGYPEIPWEFMAQLEAIDG